MTLRDLLRRLNKLPDNKLDGPAVVEDGMGHQSRITNACESKAEDGYYANAEDGDIVLEIENNLEY